MKPVSSSTPRRRYPRADLKAKARLSSVGGGSHFEAVLPTRNISVGGIFFESTFFLKVGQRLEVELTLPPDKRPVRARGQVIRVEHLNAGGKSSSGFAVRFDEYLEQSDVVLANYFLAPMLRAFIQDYAKKNRIRASEDYLIQAVDLLAAWELSKGDAADLWAKDVEENKGSRRVGR